MADRAELIERTYAAFNARDIDAVLALMAPDVDWPNGWQGGRELGHEAVRDYWLRQWAEIDPRVEPTALRELSDGRLAVDVHTVVRDRAGALIDERDLVHVYTFAPDGLIVRMDIE
jgi:hypothetical protein